MNARRSTLEWAALFAIAAVVGAVVTGEPRFWVALAVAGTVLGGGRAWVVAAWAAGRLSAPAAVASHLGLLAVAALLFVVLVRE